MLKRVLHIYNKYSKIKKQRYFYEFYKRALKKGINNNKRKNNIFLNQTTKRNKSINDLEKKFYQKEEEICTFTPKINKKIHFNDKLKKNLFNENIIQKSQYSENNMPPIFILPASSRIYYFDEENKNFKIGELIQSFINRNSTLTLENNKLNSFKENSKTIDCLYNYSRKKNYFTKNNKNIYSLNDIISNNKKHKNKPSKKKFISLNEKYFHGEENNKNYFEKEKYVPLNREYYNTFRGTKAPKINFNENENNNFKTNDLSKINAIKNYDYPFYNLMNNIPRTCHKANTTLNLLEKKSQKKTKINKLYYLNDKIDKIYLNNYTTKNCGFESTISNKRKPKKINELKRINSLNINNETRGYSASNSSAKEIQYNKTNSKKDSYRSNTSNFTTLYKSRSTVNKRNFNKKNNNKNINQKNETHTTLQSMSDSKFLEMAEYFINKKDKDDFLNDICYKKFAFYKNNSNKNKNIIFSY